MVAIIIFCLKKKWKYDRLQHKINVCSHVHAHAHSPRPRPRARNDVTIFAKIWYFMRIRVHWHHRRSIGTEQNLISTFAVFVSERVFKISYNARQFGRIIISFFHSLSPDIQCPSEPNLENTQILPGLLLNFWMINSHRHLIFHKQIFKRLYCVLAAGRPITYVKYDAHCKLDDTQRHATLSQYFLGAIFDAVLNLDIHSETFERTSRKPSTATAATETAASRENGNEKCIDTNTIEMGKYERGLLDLCSCVCRIHLFLQFVIWMWHTRTHTQASCCKSNFEQILIEAMLIYNTQI